MFMRKKHYQKAGDEITGGKKRPPLQVELVLNSKKKKTVAYDIMLSHHNILPVLY